MLKPERIMLSEFVAAGPASPLVRRVEDLITRGSVFVYPTETIYGIGGIATDEVNQKVIAAKQRKPEQPFIRIAGDRCLFERYRPVYTPEADMLIKTFWPGPLTLIVRVAGPEKTIGIRLSDHSFMQKAARFCPYPFFSTSANISGEPYVNDPDTIFHLFSHDISFMIDDGILPGALPSTVVDVSRPGDMCVLRTGAVSREAIHAIFDR